MKLSIVTINYNNLSGLINTVESVIKQTWLDFEYIIIDGGSTDGSVEYLNEKSSNFDFFISELDLGIYDAMNKGIKVAKGDYLLFLNSGDYILDSHGLYDIFVINNHSFQTLSSVYYWDGLGVKNNKVIHKIFVPEKIKLRQFFISTVPHSGFSLIRRDMFEKYGTYDNENYKYCSDWLFYLKLYLGCEDFVKIQNVELCCFDLTGISNTGSAKIERQLLLDKYDFLFEDCKTLILKSSNFWENIRFVFIIKSKLKKLYHWLLFKLNNLLNIR